MPTLFRGRCRARSLAVLAAVATTALLGPATQGASAQALAPATSAGDKVGLSTHLFWLGESDITANLTRLRGGGAGWIREDFLWDQIEPAKGDFRWGRSDALMASAARTGTNVLAILDYSARWASSDPSGGGDIHYPPKNFADYATFATKVVERYGSNGTFWAARPDLPRRPLAAVELWNEPWGSWFWKPNPDPAAYARLVRTAATAIRAAKPDMKILISGDLIAIRSDGRGARWLEDVLAADGGLAPLFDAYSTHPYPSPRNRGPLDTTSGPEYRFDRAQLTRDIASARASLKPVWITEVGWSTAASVSDAVTEATQATFVKDAIGNAITKQKVERIFIFGWDRSNGVATDREGNYGLQRFDGIAQAGLDGAHGHDQQRVPGADAVARRRRRPRRPPPARRRPRRRRADPGPDAADPGPDARAVAAPRTAGAGSLGPARPVQEEGLLDLRARHVHGDARGAAPRGEAGRAAHRAPGGRAGWRSRRRRR